MLEQDHLNMITVLLGQGAGVVCVNFLIGVLEAYRRTPILATYRWCYLPIQGFGTFFLAVNIYVMHSEHLAWFFASFSLASLVMLLYITYTEGKFLSKEKV
jgi:hypothetical protein